MFIHQEHKKRDVLLLTLHVIELLLQALVYLHAVSLSESINLHNTYYYPLAIYTLVHACV